MPHDVIRAFEEGGGLDRSRGAEPRIGGHVRIPRSRFAPPRVGEVVEGTRVNVILTYNAEPGVRLNAYTLRKFFGV